MKTESTQHYVYGIEEYEENVLAQAMGICRFRLGIAWDDEQSKNGMNRWLSFVSKQDQQTFLAILELIAK